MYKLTPIFMSGADKLNDKALVAELGRRGVSDTLQAQITAALAERPLVKGALTGSEPAPVGQPDKAPDKPVLSPEQMTELLAALEASFNNTPEHYNNPAFRQHREGIAFAKVRTCLENDPALARTVYAMHKRGGAPDVLGRAGKSFLFFEAAQETCPKSRDCVYDERSVDLLRNMRPDENFNGSVEKQRREMGGAGVMSEALWRKMQELGIFTIDNWEWLDSDDIAATDRARYASRGGDYLFVNRGGAEDYGPYRGWRAVAKGSGA